MKTIGIKTVTEDPNKFTGIIAVDKDGNSFILDCSCNCADADLFPNGYHFDDNGITLFKDTNKLGVYEVEFRPWSHKDYEGDYDCGIDVILIKVLWQGDVEKP